MLMLEENKITPEEAWIANQAPVELAPQRFLIDAPHWVLSYVGPELEKMFGRQTLYRGGLRVTTTLDLDLQKKAEAILEKWISELRGDLRRPQRRPGGAWTRRRARSWPTSAAATTSGTTSWARTTWRWP